MDIVKSFLDQTPYDLPFEVQLGNHIRRSRFHVSFDWENYCQDLIFTLGVMIQQTNRYGINDTWFKEVPNFGFKLILFDEKHAKVRTAFRTYKGAPRALSKNEFENIQRSKGNINGIKWSLKEYCIADRKIYEEKSFDNWIANYPQEKGEEIPFSQWEESTDQNFEKIFNQNHKKVKKFVEKTTRLHNLISEYFLYYSDLIKNKWVLKSPFNSECAFHHGVQLAFHSVTHLTPEVIHVLDDSKEGLFMRFKEENEINTHRIPTVLSFSKSLSANEQSVFMKQFSTRSGFYGKSLLLSSHAHTGSGGVFKEIGETIFKQDWLKRLFQFATIEDWLLDELDTIWPVNIQAPVDEFDVFHDFFYLSRYIAGVICSIESSKRNVQHKVEKFEDYHSNQFLFSTTEDKMLLEVNEYVVPLDKVAQVEINNKNMFVVKINQYIDRNRVLKRNVLFFPPSSDQNVECLENFSNFAGDLSFNLITEDVHNQELQLKIYDAIKKCFDDVEIFLDGRPEMKAFINGALHYYATISSSGRTIQKTMGIFRAQECMTLLTMNFLTEHETPPLSNSSLEYMHKTVNIVYKKPYSVNLVEDYLLSGLFE